MMGPSPIPLADRPRPVVGRSARAAGFSLIEALVSLLVISVGMIGIAALYGQGLTAGRVALSRTLAVDLASVMAEDIRVNRLGQAAYAGPAANNNCGPSGGGVCTPAQMAAHDLFLWNQDIQAQLPNGVGQVVFAAGAPPTYTITVTWDDVGLGRVTEQMVVRVPTI